MTGVQSAVKRYLKYRKVKKNTIGRSNVTFDRFDKSLEELDGMLSKYNFEELPALEPKNRYQSFKRSIYLWFLNKRDGSWLHDDDPKPFYGKIFSFLRRISPIKHKRRYTDTLYFVYREEVEVENFVQDMIKRRFKIKRVIDPKGEYEREKLDLQINKISKEITITLCPFDKYRVDFYNKGGGTFGNFFETVEEIENFLIKEDSMFKAVSREMRLKRLLN